MQKLKVELKNLKHSSHTIVLSNGTIFDQKNAGISKIKGFLVVKGIFSETTCVYLCSKIQVYSIILKSF